MASIEPELTAEEIERLRAIERDRQHDEDLDMLQRWRERDWLGFRS